MGIPFQAEIRRFVANAFSGSTRTVRMTQIESLAVAQVEPPKFDMTRAGRRFLGGNQIIANGIAPVAAIPTTTATLALYNTNSERSLAIERIGFWLGSGTAAAGATLLATVSTNPIASPPSAMATGYGIQSASGRESSKCLWATGVTLPGTPTPAWFQVLSTFQLAAANVGQGDDSVDLEGMIVVPPLRALGLAILSGAGTTPLYGVSCVFSEIEAAY